jgi:hypothetical protein
MADHLICPHCEGKFKTKQSLATHKRRYHPLQLKKLQQHDHPSHHATSEDDTSGSDSDTDNESEHTKTSQHGIGISGTENEDTDDNTVDGMNSLKNIQSESASDDSVITPKIKPSRKRKTMESRGHKKKNRSSLANKNIWLQRQKNLFDDHMKLHQELEALSSIEEKLDKINTTLRKMVSESKSPWSRLDAFQFKKHYFPNLEECSRKFFSKPVKDVLTETENNFVDAVQSEENLTDLTILLNENKHLFQGIVNRFNNCFKHNKEIPTLVGFTHPGFHPPRELAGVG